MSPLNYFSVDQSKLKWRIFRKIWEILISLVRLQDVYLSTVTRTVSGGQIYLLYNVLASHTTHVVCVNFILKHQGLQFHFDSEHRFFFRHFQVYLLLEFFPKICLEEITEEYFFLVSFWYLIWYTNPPGFTSKKPTNTLSTKLRRLREVLISLKYFC